MARKKNSIALFEVISKSRANQEQLDMNVPEWMGGQSAQPPSEQSVKAKPKAAAKAASGPSDARVSTDGGKLRLCLDYTSCSVLAGVLILLLAITFVLGRATVGNSAGPDKADQSAGVTGGETDGGTASGTANIQPRVVGKYYLVIQALKDEDEADKIVAYLGENDIGAQVMQYQDNLIVWSLDPYDIGDSPQAMQYIEAIKELGQRYLAVGGKHGFKQTQGNGWWIQHRVSNPPAN